MPVGEAEHRFCTLTFFDLPQKPRSAIGQIALFVLAPIARHGLIITTRKLCFFPMKVSIIATGIAVALIIPAHAIECQLSKGTRGYHWAWREIDSRRCWYEGERGIAKSELHWPALSHAIEPRSTELSSKSQLSPPSSTDLAPPLTEPSPPNPTTLTPANGSFDDRWSAWQGDPNVRQFETDFSR